MSNSRTEKQCRLCCSDDLVLAIDLPPSPVGDNYSTSQQLTAADELFPMAAYLCRQCGQIQLQETVNPGLIYENYSYQTSLSIGLTEHFQRYSQSLSAQFENNELFIVDIGCNDGSLLSAFSNNNCTLLGIEPAKALAAQVQQSGINVINDYFSPELCTGIIDQYGQADIITANNVMANIPDLNEFFRAIKALLNDGGIFSFESGYLPDLIAESVLDNIYHEHLCYFRVNPLVRLLASYELELFDISHSDSKGGSIQGLVQHKNGPRKITAAVDERIMLENGLLYDDIEVYRQFSQQMQMVKKQLNSLLDELLRNGKKIAGYGASVGVTTLLYYYQLDNQKIDVLYDDNPAKQGLYSPGLKIPVRPSAEIYDNRPDYILLFPWRYADNIMARHQKFLDSGGHFIIPLPSVKLI